MDLLSFFQLFNYGLVLVYGLFLSVLIAGGWETQRQKRLIVLLCPVLLGGQSLSALLWGVASTEKLYPLIIHLPMILALVLGLKKKVGIAAVSVLAAYLCCQFPRIICLLLTDLCGSALVGEIGYTLCIGPIFYLLWRYFVPAVHSAITLSRRTLILFGSLPVVYYLFDYAAVVYTDILSMSLQSLAEFLPSALLVFYIIFLVAYHGQVQKLMHTELQNSVLESQRKLSVTKLEDLRRAETQAAIYQHDMRHHLVMIEGFLSAGKPHQAEAYIQSVRESVDTLLPQRFCENETVNLLCAAFCEQARKLDISLECKVTLPETLSIPDIELCAVLSNGLENALHAAAALEDGARWVSLSCSLQRNKLLLAIRNPYTGQVIMRNGLPVSQQSGHGYGCQSIHAIVEQHRGMYSFEPANGVFTLRVMLPIL